MSFFTPDFTKLRRKKSLFLSYKYAHVSVQVCNFLIFLTIIFILMHLHCTYCIDSHYPILKFKKFDVNEWRKESVMVKAHLLLMSSYLLQSPQLPSACNVQQATQTEERLSGVIAEWIQG
jgi:hypothetical protein